MAHDEISYFTNTPATEIVLSNALFNIAIQSVRNHRARPPSSHRQREHDASLNAFVHPYSADETTNQFHYRFNISLIQSSDLFVCVFNLCWPGRLCLQVNAVNNIQVPIQPLHFISSSFTSTFFRCFVYRDPRPGALAKCGRSISVWLSNFMNEIKGKSSIRFRKH